MKNRKYYAEYCPYGVNISYDSFNRKRGYMISITLMIFIALTASVHVMSG